METARLGYFVFRIRCWGTNWRYESPNRGIQYLLKGREKMIELLGGSMMPTRPCPSREGLVKIGYTDDGESIEDVMLNNHSYCTHQW